MILSSAGSSLEDFFDLNHYRYLMGISWQEWDFSDDIYGNFYSEIQSLILSIPEASRGMN